MRRLPDGFLKEYLKYCSSTEVPGIFSLWCGIACIASALGRDGFMSMGHYTIFPNLYIILVAGSAKCKKSTAIRIADGFIKKVTPDIKTFSQKLTPEALIGALCEVKEASANQLRGSAEGIIVVDELSTLIDRNAFQSGMIPFLTTLWDAQESFTYETKKRGKETVYNSCVSMLGGSTLSWIREAIPISAIGGGFTSRVIFVFREQYEKSILWTSMSEENRKRGENLLHDLNEIAKVRGEFGVTEKVKTVSEQLYSDFRASHPFHANKYLEGYAGRRFTTLLKLAMIVCASLSDNRLIKLEHLNAALNVLEDAEGHMPKVLQTIAMDDIGMVNQDILSLIKSKGRVTRKKLLTLVHHQMQARDLDIVLSTLSQAGEIKENIGKSGGVTYEVIAKKKKEEESFTSKVLDRKEKKK